MMYHYKLINWLILKSLTISSAGEYVEEEDLS